MLHHASLQASLAGADWRVLRCRGRASCVRPVGFLKEGPAQDTQSTDIAAKKAATKVAVFSSGKTCGPLSGRGGEWLSGVVWGEVGAALVVFHSDVPDWWL